MKRTIGILMGLAAVLLTLTVVAQVQNEGLANGVIAARKKEAAALQQLNWNSRIDILRNGALQDIRIYMISYAPGGQLQRSLINDQESPLQGGFFRKAIEENQRKELEKYVADVAKLVEQYTLPTPGKVIDYLVTAQVQPITTPNGTTLLQINGNNVVVPGDTFSMSVDGKTLSPTGLQISSTCNGDALTASATFKAAAGSIPAHLQYATVTVPGKNLTIMIHNYDYMPNN